MKKYKTQLTGIILLQTTKKRLLTQLNGMLAQKYILYR